MKEIVVRTHSHVEFVDITSQVNEAVGQSGMTEGIVLIYVPHTTAGVTINENADPDVVTDINDRLNKLAPANGGYRHIEGNADAHIKSSLVGVSQAVPVVGGRMKLGTWQAVFFCEFDGPRTRRVQIVVK